jgi:hypothetical protein
MCEPSKVTDDWVTKGCHIHVNGVELNVYTNYSGRIDFRAVFTSTHEERVKEAIKAAFDDCLADPDVRRRWIRRLEMGRIFMLDYRGELHRLANGRMLEFKFIRIAIERWGEKYAKP